MRHARSDYNRIQDPLNKIGQDEPVFLLRSKDKFAPKVVRLWADLVEATGGYDLANHVREFASEMELWQTENGSKTPDAPEEELKR